MDRITMRRSHGVLMAPGWDFDIDPDDYDLVQEILARLAAYEDTGLEPEEIERIVDAYGRGMTLREEVGQRIEIIREIKTDRLRELAEAEQAGKLIAIPDPRDDGINDPLEPMKLGFALQSEVRKLEYRLKNNPKSVCSLDYTIIAALKKALEVGGVDG